MNIIIMKRFQKNVHVNNIKMLHYSEIGVSEIIDVIRQVHEKSVLFAATVIF